MTQYAKQTQLLLGASPYDIPLGKVLKSVVVSIANNLITGSGTGISVTILPNGATPGYTLQYGAANDYPLENVSWIRLSGNGANVSFDVSDKPVAITPTIVGSAGQHTIYETESTGGIIAHGSGAQTVNGSATLPFGTLVSYNLSVTGKMVTDGSTLFIGLQGHTSSKAYALMGGPNAIAAQFYMTTAEKLDTVYNNADTVDHYMTASWQATAA